MKKTILLIFIFVLQGYTQSNIVKLQKIKPDTKSIQLANDYVLRPTSLYSKYDAFIKSKYKIKTEHDSIKFYVFTGNEIPFLYTLMKDGLFDESEFDSLIAKLHFDSPTQKVNQHFNAAIVYKNNKKEILVDFNKNFEFYDENYPKNSADEITSLYNLETVNYRTNQIDNISRNVSLVFSKEEQVSNILTFSSVFSDLKLRFTDMEFGEVKIENLKYKLYALPKSLSPKSYVLLPNDFTDFSDEGYIRQFKVYENQPLILNNFKYFIENGNNLDEVVISKNEEVLNGNSIGNTFSDFELESLVTKDKIKAYDLTQSNEYTLFNFWATWCGYCVKNFKTLKEIKANNKNVNIVGFAYENNEESLNLFLKKHKLDWSNFRFYHDFNTSVKETFNVGTYPTYILVDKNNKIIYRGNKLEAVLKIINK